MEKLTAMRKMSTAQVPGRASASMTRGRFSRSCPLIRATAARSAVMFSKRPASRAVRAAVPFPFRPTSLIRFLPIGLVPRLRLRLVVVPVA